jgi:hypothetical protein
MLFFGWAALPGIVLGLLLTITRGMTLEDSIGVIFFIFLFRRFFPGAGIAFLSRAGSKSRMAM